MITLLEAAQLPPRRIHLGHPARRAYCGVTHRKGITQYTYLVADTTCPHCLRIYDLELSNRAQITGETW